MFYLSFISVSIQAVENGLQLLDVDGDGKDDLVFSVGNDKFIPDIMSFNDSSVPYNFLREHCKSRGMDNELFGKLVAPTVY